MGPERGGLPVPTGIMVASRAGAGPQLLQAGTEGLIPYCFFPGPALLPGTRNLADTESGEGTLQGPALCAAEQGQGKDVRTMAPRLTPWDPQATLYGDSEAC